jgi:hypothetical protein
MDRTKYEIDEDNRIKKNIERDFEDNNWFREIKDIAPTTRSQIDQLDRYFDTNNVKNRNISFYREIVDIGPMSSYQLNKRSVDLLIGCYAYDACEFDIKLDDSLKFQFDFVTCGFKYTMDDVSCLPIASTLFQPITIENKKNTALKISLLNAYLSLPFYEKLVMYVNEYQGKGRSFISRSGVLFQKMIYKKI